MLGSTHSFCSEDSLLLDYNVAGPNLVGVCNEPIVHLAVWA